MSETLVLLEFAGQPLALSQEAFHEALVRGREMVAGSSATPSGAKGDAPEDLCTAAEMQARTKVKAAWFLEGARQGLIPHHRLGKYVRFRFDEVLACSRFRDRGK